MGKRRFLSDRSRLNVPNRLGQNNEVVWRKTESLYLQGFRVFFIKIRKWTKNDHFSIKTSLFW
jgi:hypothetical protein